MQDYGQICWKKPTEINNLIIRLNKKYDHLKSHSEFISCINKNYANLFHKEFTNYSDIDQRYRCNSVLEGFHALLNKRMQNVKTIGDFVTCIKELENDSYNKLFNLERRGIKKFEPILNSEICYDSLNINNNNNNKPQEVNKIRVGNDT